MTLQPIEINPEAGSIPEPIERIVHNGWEQTRSFQDQERLRAVKGFHSSDFEDSYHWLAVLKSKLEEVETPTFCEWGGGLAVVSLLAEKLGFRATSIESDTKLHQASLGFHHEHESSCRCVQGSFIPAHVFDEHQLKKPESGESMWLDLDCEDAYSKLHQQPYQFDVIYVYPWPGESEFIFDLFDKIAKSGAYLLTFHGAADFRLHQKS